MKRQARTAFSWDTATAMVDSYAHTSGVHCRLYNEQGILLYEQGGQSDGCAFCRRMTALMGKPLHCERIHQHGALEAERFGGRYIYFCPSGLAYFSSPILTAGKLTGALVGGPVLIMDAEDLLDMDVLTSMAPKVRGELMAALDTIPRMEPARLSHLSAQLFANTVLISDDTNTFFLTQHSNRQQNAIGDFIQQFKGQEERSEYPLETERVLVRAISQRDQEGAEERLNRLMGYIYSTSDREEIATDRTVDLVVMMGRGALVGQMRSDHVFDICARGIQALRLNAGREQKARILSEVLRRLLGAMDAPAEGEQTDMVRRAVAYMRRNCHRKLTVGEVADHVGYSVSHFSRTFSGERGMTFQESLNRIRVEKSKLLLLEQGASIAEVGGLVGIPDQSYFCKVFKSVTGVTPDQYRKRRRRIDERKEYGD